MLRLRHINRSLGEKLQINQFRFALQALKWSFYCINHCNAVFSFIWFLLKSVDCIINEQPERSKNFYKTLLGKSLLCLLSFGLKCLHALPRGGSKTNVGWMSKASWLFIVVSACLALFDDDGSSSWKQISMRLAKQHGRNCCRVPFRTWKNFPFAVLNIITFIWFSWF